MKKVSAAEARVALLSQAAILALEAELRKYRTAVAEARRAIEDGRRGDALSILKALTRTPPATPSGSPSGGKAA